MRAQQSLPRQNKKQKRNNRSSVVADVDPQESGTQILGVKEKSRQL
jgi:hypothetical protein